MLNLFYVASSFLCRWMLKFLEQVSERKKLFRLPFRGRNTKFGARVFKVFSTEILETDLVKNTC
jgi:hypothetical protein